MVHQSIPEEIQTVIKKHGTEVTLQIGEVLFRQHAPSEAVYLVTHGKLAVMVENENNEHGMLLNYIMPGEIAGEIGAMTGWHRSATLVAEQPTTLIQLSQQQFGKVLQDNPVLAKILMCTTGSYLLTADAERVNLGRSYQQMQLRVNTLGQERTQLIELLRLREEMEAMLVHDLRNPLNIIKTGVALLSALNISTHNDPDTATTILDLMTGATQRMQNLTNALLDIAKMEAGKANLHLKKFNVVTLASTTINEQKVPLEERKIELNINGPFQMEIEADRDILHRVFVNILDNALKFTPTNATIQVDIQAPQNGWIEISITDSGPGIPAEERERIFEKFTQVKNPAAPYVRKGAGLGLTFCRMAIEAHGGKIWVEAGPDDKGACFHIKLPQYQTEKAHDAE